MTANPTLMSGAAEIAAKLTALAERCEAAMGPDRALNREIALLAGGWHRYTPSQIGRSNPGWISPEDFIGEYSSKNGPSPRLDSLHGTTIYREPPAYTASLDAAMTLAPEGWHVADLVEDWRDGYWLCRLNQRPTHAQREAFDAGECIGLQSSEGKAATAALALCAAALRARAHLSRESGE